MAPSSVVMKFGGTSVEDARAFVRVAEIIAAERASRPVVVVSAMSRMTDALLAGVRSAAAERSEPEAAYQLLAEHIDRHALVSRELLARDEQPQFESALDHAIGGITELLRQISARHMPLPVLQDAVVSYGERLAATLLAAVLRSRGTAARDVDARRCVITNAEHGRAAPLPEQTNRSTRAQLVPLINQAIVPVLGGFIGATSEGATTTLGRGGSDYSAALVGAALKSREVQIWTDVAGVLTADPRVVPHARTISRLSFAEAAELAYFGAKVLHPKTIQPALEEQIPVRICNSRARGEAGTLVCAETEVKPLAVKAIAHKQGIVVLQITAARMLGAYGFLRAVFEIFERHRTAVDVVATSEVSISLTIDDRTALAAIVGDLRHLGTVEVEDGRAIICVVGEGLRSTPGVAARVFEQLRDINISLISQGASSINLTFVTDERRAPEAVARLHGAFFE